MANYSNGIEIPYSIEEMKLLHYGKILKKN